MNIDFYECYKKRGTLFINKESFLNNLKLDEPYIKILKRYLKPNSSILECGCGQARTALSMAYNEFNITAIDDNKKILGVAKENAKNLGLDNKLNFILMNFFNIDKEFNNKSFDCITHQGVIEHYNEDEIRKILNLQLSIAPIIIFSVPIKTDFNEKEYFKDSIHRNLWTEEYWLEKILKDFYVMDYKVVKQRTDNLIVVIERLSKDTAEQIELSEINRKKGKSWKFVY